MIDSTWADVLAPESRERIKPPDRPLAFVNLTSRDVHCIGKLFCAAYRELIEKLALEMGLPLPLQTPYVHVKCPPRPLIWGWV